MQAVEAQKERDALRQQLRDLQEAHELAIAELSRPLAEREAELREAFGADDVDAAIAGRDAAIRRADAAEARLRLVGDAVAALVEVARG
jgi:Spy/CpxP family protein refolding chaperone